MHILKALTTTHWGKSKETLNITYKAITRPILEYASTIWSPIISNTNMNKLQTIQNSALQTITGCTLDTNTHHLHTGTKILPIDTHMKLHRSQLRQQAQDPEHTLHQLTTQEPPPRLKKQTIFHNNNYTTNIDTPPNTTTQETVRADTAQIHTQIISKHMQAIPHNKILNRTPPEISEIKQALPHYTRRLLAQLRTTKSPMLHEYLHKITHKTRTTPNCPLCHSQIHDTKHLFNCPRLLTNLGPEALWDDPGGAAGLLARWLDQLGWGLEQESRGEGPLSELPGIDNNNQRHVTGSLPFLCQCGAYLNKKSYDKYNYFF